jgi:hypothetical protein
MAATVLRPDAKGRVGLESLTRLLRERFGGQPISGYAAEITPDGTIVLRPRVEVDADQAATLVLTARDRELFLEAVATPAKPAARLRGAARRHRRNIGRP